MNDEKCPGAEGCEYGRQLRGELERIQTDLRTLTKTVNRHDDAIAKHDTTFAVINTKLSAILWGVGVIGAALLGYLVKLWVS